MYGEKTTFAIRKAMVAETKRREQPSRPQGGKALGRAQWQLLIDETAVTICHCVASGKRNKDYAPYPALITRTGKKDID